MKTKKQDRTYEHQCTECGGDAFIGMSDWTGPDGVIIGEDERLCIRCGRKRGIGHPFTQLQMKPSYRGKK
jgi:hypothetical protein